MTEPLQKYVEQFKSLGGKNPRNPPKPHKPCLLLAVIDSAECGALKRNEIYYESSLLERFTLYFEAVRGPADGLTPHYPFFHLKNDKFWHLHPAVGRESYLTGTGDKVRHSHSGIALNIKYASLDPELHTLLLDREARHELRKALVRRWFREKQEQVWNIIEQIHIANQYENALRYAVEQDKALKVSDNENVREARSTAFRRVVMEAYDYRCAASGWRLVFPDGTSLADAAHLIPFAESHDDDPRNGIALTPTYHRALDRGLIAPGPDMKWHVSNILDKRIRDHQLLLDLSGQDVILDNPRYKPFEAALKWRIENLWTK